MTKNREQVPDVQAVNPRYRGAMMSDVARAMVTDPKVRERLEKRWKDDPGAKASVNSTR